MSVRLAVAAFVVTLGLCVACERKQAKVVPAAPALPVAAAASGVSPPNGWRKVAPGLLVPTLGGRIVRVIIVLKPLPSLGVDLATTFNNLRQQLPSDSPAFTSFRPLRNLPLAAAAVNRDGLLLLEQAQEVERVVPDAIAYPTATWNAKRVNADDVWVQGVEGAGASVAILDTGIDAQHPFLKNRIIEQRCFSLKDQYGRKSLCPNGDTADASANSATPANLEFAEHGTHVAGIAAGRDGTFSDCQLDGIARKASIVAVQVFSDTTAPGDCDGGGSCLATFASSQIEAFKYLQEHHARLKLAAVNMSFSNDETLDVACDTDERTTYVQDLQRVGVETVIAAGNESTAFGVGRPGCISPALTVGAVTNLDTPILSTGRVVDLLAPGLCITSSVPGGGYASFDGTSMAAPHVAGAIAAFRGGPDPLPVADIVKALLDGASEVTECRTLTKRKRLNLLGARVRLTSSPPPGVGPGGSAPVGGVATPPSSGPGSSPPTTGTAPGPVLGNEEGNDCLVAESAVCPALCGP